MTRTEVNNALAGILQAQIDIPEHLQANQVMLDYTEQLVTGAITGNTWMTDKANYYTKSQTDTYLSTKADLVGGLVPSNQLPSFVDDVLEFSSLASFPTTGTTGKIYVATDTNFSYRWGGSTYVQIISGNFILNQTSSVQPSSGFWISGNGKINGSLEVGPPVGVTGAISDGIITFRHYLGGGVIGTLGATTSGDRVQLKTSLFQIAHTSGEGLSFPFTIGMRNPLIYDIGGQQYIKVRGQGNGSTPSFIQLWSSDPASTSNNVGIDFRLNRTTGGETVVGRIAGMITDIGNATYKGGISFQTANGAAVAERVRIAHDGLTTFYNGLTAPEAGISSERFGTNASTGGFNYTTALGNGANTTGHDAVAIGQNASSAQYGLAIGRNALASAQSFALGRNASANAGFAIAMGYGANANFAGAIVLGASSATAANQFIAGSSVAGYDIREAIFGLGAEHSIPNLYGGIKIRATNAVGTNSAGADLKFAAGRSTGNAAGGYISFYTTPAGSSGSTVNTEVERLKIEGNGTIKMIGSTPAMPGFVFGADGYHAMNGDVVAGAALALAYNNAAGNNQIRFYNSLTRYASIYSGSSEMYIDLSNNTGGVGTRGLNIVNGITSKFNGNGLGINVSPTYRLDVLDSGVAQIADRRIANFSNAGYTFNTTDGQINSYGLYIDNTATRSAGSNNLNNWGIYAKATGAQVNIAGYFHNNSSTPTVRIENSDTSTGKAGSVFVITSVASMGMALKADNTFVINSSSAFSGTDYLKINNVTGAISLSNLTINSIPNATTDTDKFLVSDGGVVKYRTGSELLSDLGIGGLTAWSITGNTGTNSTIHFIGTTDDEDVVIKRNNTEAIRVTGAIDSSESPIIRNTSTISIGGEGGISVDSTEVTGDGDPYYEGHIYLKALKDEGGSVDLLLINRPNGQLIPASLPSAGDDFIPTIGDTTNIATGSTIMSNMMYSESVVNGIVTCSGSITTAAATSSLTTVLEFNLPTGPADRVAGTATTVDGKTGIIELDGSQAKLMFFATDTDTRTYFYQFQYKKQLSL